MDAAASSWMVVALALITANLPFFNEKVFALVSLKQGKDGEARRKPFFLRLVEMLVLYFIVGAAAFGLEARLGNTFEQTWEFYAITGCLFVVLAFPGFVVRYLRKK